MPTKDVLRVKQVACEPMCLLCGESEETVVHLFTNCTFAHECWRGLSNVLSLEEVASMNDWVEVMWEIVPKDHIKKVVTVCWFLWENRNKMAFDSQFIDPGSVSRLALLYLMNWQAAQNVNIVVHRLCLVHGASFSR